MPDFRYRAAHASGRIQRGVMAAANENELAHFLNESGLELIEAAPPPKPSFPNLLNSKNTLRQRVNVCGQMEDLLRAGLPFLTALKEISVTLPHGQMRHIVDDIARSVSNGAKISAAFGKHPRLFSPVFLAILKSGESSGDITLAFSQATEQLRWQMRFRALLGRALRYPLFLLVVAIGVTTFMMTMVVPPLVDFINSLSSELPFLTRLLIETSAAFASCWWMALLAIAAGVSLVAVIRRQSEAVRLITDAWILAVPVLGSTMRKLAIARFAHSFAVLLRSDVDLPQSLAAATAVLGNRKLIAIAEAAQAQVQNGQSLSTAAADILPTFATQMLRVGEKSGQLVKSLNDITRYCDADATATVERFLGALEPALTILVGALLAWIVLAILGPIYGSVGVLGRSV